jgi:hypothetical protein
VNGVSGLSGACMIKILPPLAGGCWGEGPQRPVGSQAAYLQHCSANHDCRRARHGHRAAESRCLGSHPSASRYARFHRPRRPCVQQHDKNQHYKDPTASVGGISTPQRDSCAIPAIIGIRQVSERYPFGKHDRAETAQAPPPIGKREDLASFRHHRTSPGLLQLVYEAGDDIQAFLPERRIGRVQTERREQLLVTLSPAGPQHVQVLRLKARMPRLEHRI